MLGFAVCFVLLKQNKLEISFGYFLKASLLAENVGKIISAPSVFTNKRCEWRMNYASPTQNVQNNSKLCFCYNLLGVLDFLTEKCWNLLMLIEPCMQSENITR